MAVPLIGQFWTVVTTAQLPVTLLLRWLRGVDLNHRPLGYEPHGCTRYSQPNFSDSPLLIKQFRIRTLPQFLSQRRVA